MYAQVEKLKENKTKAVANSVSQKKDKNQLTSGFVDNREMFSFSDNRKGANQQLQRKIQTTDHNSLSHPMQKQVNNIGVSGEIGSLNFRSLRSSASGTANSVVVQRAVDLSTLSTTQNDLYYTVVNGGTKLISKAFAPAPEPKPLYNEEEKTAMNGDNLKVWKPRSKFADKKKLSGETPVYGAANQLLTRYFDIEDTVMAEIMGDVEGDIENRQGDRGLRLGTAGMNDCKGYATTLKAMIAKYGDNPQGLVGKSWLHETRQEAANFPYHGATVVAQDGNDAVTLEAHAGQELTVPKFHIRPGGKTGFEDSNKESYPNQYQDSASESPLMQIEDAERVLATLKAAWDDPTQRSDKSAVKKSGPIPETPGRNWKLIGTLLVAAIGAFVTIHQIYQDK